MDSGKSVHACTLQRHHAARHAALARRRPRPKRTVRHCGKNLLKPGFNLKKSKFFYKVKKCVFSSLDKLPWRRKGLQIRR
jgi:hypothetical protein